MPKQRKLLVIILIVFVVLVGLFVLVALGLVMFVGIGLEAGVFADTKVLPGDELPAAIVETVTESAGLWPDEEIIYYYGAEFRPKDDGNLLTDQRIISYVNDGTEQWCEWMFVHDVVDVQFERSQDWLEDSVVTVVSGDGTEIVLYLSNEEGGDVKFVKALRAAAGLAPK